MRCDNLFAVRFSSEHTGEHDISRRLVALFGGSAPSSPSTAESTEDDPQAEIPKTDLINIKTAHSYSLKISGQPPRRLVSTTECQSVKVLLVFLVITC